MFDDLETPCLLLDRTVLERNARRFLERAAAGGVTLRPHLKTAKSVEVAKMATGGRMSGVTVSTLKEAEYFARAGFDDLLYAVGIAPNKLPRVRAISTETDRRILVSVDSPAMADAMNAFAAETGFRLQAVVEIDCGEHRGGLAPDQREVAEIAGRLMDGGHVDFRGVMTHAGHSYATDDNDEVATIAETERRAAVDAATAIREAGVPCGIVSAGSTPTVLHARSFEGLTEVRSGVHVFFDLAQYSRGICGLDDIALTVLATVIGHNRRAGAIVLDAGALALSRDVGANTFLPDARYGHVCDPVTMRRLGTLSVDVVHQEHGTVPVPDETWFDRLPVGAMVRILPNHACLTAAGGYGYYVVVDGGRIVDRWQRIDGW